MRKVINDTYISDDMLNTFPLELQVFSSYYRRVDDVKAKGISTVLVNDLNRIGIVLQPLTHLLAITSQV
jgi:hypothetical protein